MTTSDSIPTVEGSTSPSVVLLTDSPGRPMSVKTAAGVDAGRCNMKIRNASTSWPVRRADRGL
jgi:hypothetical protein